MASSKSLGQLTLDLVARTGGFVQGLDKAERKSKKFRNEISRNLKQTGQQLEQGLKISAAAATAAIGALTAITIQQTRAGLENIDSQNKLARSLDTTFDSVTALSLAFSEGGIDGYEMSLARLNRRLGAAENGSGEAAKTVGALNLNLQELSGLEADERLARIADAIVESGASAQQAARYAQQLGFEQRQAAQFFLQGGDAIRAYRQQVDEFGLSVDSVDAVKVEQANDAFARTGLIFDAVSQQLAIQVAPILSGVSELFIQNAKDAGGVGEATADAFNVVIEGAAEGVNNLAKLDRGFLKTQTAADIFARKVRIGLLEVAREIVEIPTAAVNEMISVINSIPGVDMEMLGMSDLGKAIQGEIAEANQEITDLNEKLRDELGKPLPGDQFKRFVFEAREAAEQSAEALAGIQEAAGLNLGQGSGGDAGDDEKYQQRVDALRQAFETEKQEALRIFGERNEEINELYHADALSKMEADHLKIQSEEQMQERLAEIRKKQLDDEARLQQQRQALILGGAEGLFGSLADLSGKFAGEQSALYKTMFAVQKAAAIAQSIVAINTGIAQAAAVPFPANLAAMASVAAATTGLVGNIQSVGLNLTGQAHDGIDRVPREGTWLLDQDERVLTAPQADKLDRFLASQRLQGGRNDAPIVNIIENPSKAGSVQAKQNGDGQWVIDVIVADALSGGRASKTYESVYGMKRQGR
ncbi:hypothetical protein [Marinobacter nauticus]|uniref:hypothetical protein n=1 Tax=Marinobacter nauticus TaxID=2743 RepID=UPI001C99231A|nr:hypothetical protein [Marinobacter nauticus]MBY5961722.1 hypothetical protein [Marinobacter nauticus]